jgi:FtsZ-binding cell division protein ZapB
MSTPQSESELDSLANLEERIRRAVELMGTLKAERDAALSDLAEARVAMAELAPFKKAAAEAERLRQEVDGLKVERKQVRVRIEKLLGQMDQLSGQ